jgi:hypothetical protein
MCLQSTTHDYDYLLSLLDWDANVDPHFKDNHFLEPRPTGDPAAQRAEGYQEKWIVYGSDAFSAKELTVLPGRTVAIRDAAAYGMVRAGLQGASAGSQCLRRRSFAMAR